MLLFFQVTFEKSLLTPGKQQTTNTCTDNKVNAGNYQQLFGLFRFGLSFIQANKQHNDRRAVENQVKDYNDRY